MFPAFLTTIFFSLSAVTGYRCAKIFGGVEANFYRLCIATILLGIYTHSIGAIASKNAASAFFLSGVIGVGLGDWLFFQTLPRLGSRLTVLLIQCLSVPFAALVEWLWLGTMLHFRQSVWIALILVGLALALWPNEKNISWRKLFVSRQQLAGVCLGILAAFGNGFGAVLSRKAYAVAQNAGENVDGFSAAYARVLGGLLVAVVLVLCTRWTRIREAISTGVVAAGYKSRWRAAWPWVIATSLAGQTFGVSSFQWALKNNPTAIVLPIVALTPLVAIPFTYILENERPTMKSLFGASIAVIGVVLLLRGH